MMETKVGWMNGVVVISKTGGLIFDPSRKGCHKSLVTFISHAHSDHTKGVSADGKGYLTTETKDILLNGNHRETLENFVSLRYGDKVSFDGLEISIRNSGHVLGAAQYVVRDGDSTIVYTGDFNCREMLTTTAADIIACDTLILETTYGNPFYVFPSSADVYVRIINWAINEINKERTPTFVVYSVGKAQEIVKIFNELTSIPVVVSPSVARVNEAYEKNGIKLKYADFSSAEGSELLKQPCLQVVSPAERTSAKNNCSFATATGWALKSGRNYNNSSFPRAATQTSNSC